MDEGLLICLVSDILFVQAYFTNSSESKHTYIISILLNSNLSIDSSIASNILYGADRGAIAL